MRQRTFGVPRADSRHRSMPLPSGSRTSSTATSGRVADARQGAARPRLADDLEVPLGVDEVRDAARTISWSSTRTPCHLRGSSRASLGSGTRQLTRVPRGCAPEMTHSPPTIVPDPPGSGSPRRAPALRHHPVVTTSTSRRSSSTTTATDEAARAPGDVMRGPADGDDVSAIPSAEQVDRAREAQPRRDDQAAAPADDVDDAVPQAAPDSAPPSSRRSRCGSPRSRRRAPRPARRFARARPGPAPSARGLKPQARGETAG